uniref:Uncharacterized protein n=1 Tax=Oncorhynchus tshawytscha TaxID=74940 RepID=A0A8C8IP05_ONCTS
QTKKVPPHVKEVETAQVKPKEVEPGQFKLKEAELAQAKMKERQKFFEEAFQQDMDQYLSTGYLQISERRGPIGSFSSMEVNVDMLEQMDLSDHESFDVFLLSGGEDNNAASPMLGMTHRPRHTLKQTCTLPVSLSSLTLTPVLTRESLT